MLETKEIRIPKEIPEDRVVILMPSGAVMVLPDEYECDVFPSQGIMEWKGLTLEYHQGEDF